MRQGKSESHRPESPAKLDKEIGEPERFSGNSTTLPGIERAPV